MTSVSTVSDYASGKVTGTLVLQVAKPHTFSLFRLGGGWLTGDGGWLWDCRVVNSDGSLGGGPDWINGPSNTPATTITLGTWLNLGYWVWTETLRPAITPNIIDGTFNPPVVAYIPADATTTNGKLPIKSDLTLWCGSWANISYIVSKYRAPNAGDTLTPNYGNSGMGTTLSTTFSTFLPSPVATVIATQTNIGDYYSQPLNLLPAKHLQPFHCTVYFTPIEDTFDAQHGFTSKTKIAKGTNETYNKDFLRYVIKEGNGKLKTPHNGFAYIRWADEDDKYVYIHNPIGQRNVILQNQVSCAVHSGRFPFAAQILTLSYKIQARFGNQYRSVVDTGNGLESNQIDLYWQDAPPLPLSSADQGLLFRPADLGNFTESNDTPVYLWSY